jgi:hypothetical protein
LLEQDIGLDPSGQGFDELVCKVYEDTGSVDRTAEQIHAATGVSLWGTEVSRVLDRNGIGNPPGRPSEVDRLLDTYGAKLIKEVNRFPSRKAFARFVGASERTVYRALRVVNRREDWALD